MPVLAARLIFWGGTAALTAFGWKAGDEAGDDLGGAVKVLAIAGAGYLVWKAAQK